MDNVKISQLTQATTIQETDIVPFVADPAGTPATKQMTVKTLKNHRNLVSIVPAGNFSLTAGTSAQNAFPTTGDVFTLEASSTYMFEGEYFITKSGASTTIALLFALTGLTLTSMKYVVEALNVAKNTTTPTFGGAWIDQATATVVNATSTGDVCIRFRGIMRTNAAGTVTPQIQFSAAPTTPVMVADSFIRFERIGTNTEDVIGNVA